MGLHIKHARSHYSVHPYTGVDATAQSPTPTIRANNDDDVFQNVGEL